MTYISAPAGSPPRARQSFSAFRSAWRSPYSACQPSPMMRPSFTMTAPTRGFGETRPVPRSARRQARCMYSSWVMKCVPFLFSKERGRFFLLPFRTTGCKRRPGISGAPGKLRHADISDVKSAADGGIPPSANEKARRIFLRGLHSQNYTQSESSAASSSIQTVLSAPESHRIMPFGSRALPPVGTCTLP